MQATLNTQTLESFLFHLGYANIKWETRPFHFASQRFTESQIPIAIRIAEFIKNRLNLSNETIQVLKSGNEEGRRILILDPKAFARALTEYEKNCRAIVTLTAQLEALSTQSSLENNV